MAFCRFGLLLSLFPSQTICAIKSFFPVFEEAVNPRAIKVVWFCRLYGLILTSIAVFNMAEVYGVRRGLVILCACQAIGKFRKSGGDHQAVHVLNKALERAELLLS
jgi:hypothetical protein